MIIVPYAVGAASPMEIAHAAEPYGGVLFLTTSTDPLVEPAVKVLREVGTVIATAEGTAAVEAALDGRRADGVVTFADAMLPVAIATAQHLGLPCNGGHTCEWLHDKAAQRRQLNDSGVGYVAAAAFTTGEELPGELGFPLIVKPRTGAGSRHTVIVAEPAALASQLAQLPPGQAFVAEELIPGSSGDLPGWLADYLSVESAVAGGEIRHLAVTGRLPLTEPARETGALLPAPLDAARLASVHQLAEDAIRALGISVGIVHTEIKLAPDGPQVIEVNGRLGGTIGQLMRDVGLPDPVPLAVTLATGAPLPEQPPTPSRYALVFWLQPPMNAVSMTQGPAAREVRRQPGVVRVQQSRPAGQPTHWLEGTASMIYEVTLMNSDLDGLHRDLESLRRYFDQAVTWEYR